jgi:ketosteroid isomerase-like protein
MTPDEAELDARENAWDDAISARDGDAAGAIIDDDYALVLVHPEPSSVPRESWLAMLPEYVVHSWQVQERTVEVSGDLGAVLQRVDMTATVLGEDRSGVFFISDIWRRRDGEWRVWRRHSSPLTAGTLR